MSVLCRDAELGHNIQFVKGAPESVLDRCTHVMLPDGSEARLTDAARKTIHDEVERMAAGALRTLALAVRLDPGPLRDYDGHSHHQHSLLEDPDNFVT